MEKIIDLDYILSTEFEQDGLHIDSKKHEKFLGRVPDNFSFPETPEEKKTKLRKHLDVILEKNFRGSKTLVNNECLISESSFKSYLLGQRNISIEALARFCVGARISVELADELFILRDHKLDGEHNCLDAIVIYCLQHKESVEELIRVCNLKGINI